MNKYDLEMPLVSIGMPVFNRPELLDHAIYSVRAQTWPNLEIIISDNASDDPRVADVLAKHEKQDRRIRVFRQQENIGPLANFCFVLEKATADYFMWAADDDSCTPDFIEKLLRPLIAHPNLALVMSDVVTVDIEGRVIRVDTLDSIRLGEDWERARRLFFEYPTSNIFFCIYGLYRTEVLKRVQFAQLAENRGLASHGEVPFLARLATIGGIASIEGNLKRYTSHKSSVYYSELARMTRLIKLRLDLEIRMRLVIIGLDADLPWSTRMRLVLTVFRSWIAYFWRHCVRNFKNRILTFCIATLRSLKSWVFKKH